MMSPGGEHGRRGILAHSQDSPGCRGTKAREWGRMAEPQPVLRIPSHPLSCPQTQIYRRKGKLEDSPLGAPKPTKSTPKKKR